MTSYYEVSLEGVVERPEGKYRVIYTNLIFGDANQPFLKFKNKNDAEQWLDILKKLQQKKALFPREMTMPVTINNFTTSVSIPLSPVITETAFYIQGELNQTDLKKKWIKSKLDPEELTDLGLTP